MKLADKKCKSYQNYFELLKDKVNIMSRAVKEKKQIKLLEMKYRI